MISRSALSLLMGICVLCFSQGTELLLLYSCKTGISYLCKRKCALKSSTGKDTNLAKYSGFDESSGMTETQSPTSSVSESMHTFL